MIISFKFVLNFNLFCLIDESLATLFIISFCILILFLISCINMFFYAPTKSIGSLGSPPHAYFAYS